MRIAFTGTRKGMTTDQWAKLGMLLAYAIEPVYNEWHCGDAIGADHQANVTMNNIKAMFPEKGIKTFGHPCNLSDQRAYDEYDVTYDELPPLGRNRIMVDHCDLLIAAPYEYEEIIRGSGTWATMRYAARTGTDFMIAWPDGTHAETFEFKSRR